MTLILLLSTLSTLALAKEPVVSLPQPLVISLKEVAKRDEGRKYWMLKVRATEKCACNGCELETEFTKKGNEFSVEVGKVVPPIDCLEPSEYPAAEFELALDDQREYFLRVNSERYRVQVTREFAELRPLQTKLTKPEAKKVYRSLPNLVSLVCFRYEYRCEMNKKVKNELCPRLFQAMKSIAKEADLKALAKTGQVLDCTEEYRLKGQCKLYYFDGPLSELKTLHDNSNAYRLTQGLQSQCEPGNPPLYYKKFRTWDEQEVCC